MKNFKIQGIGMLFLLLVSTTACTKKIKVEENPLKTLVLKFKQYEGTNGVAVAWDPNKKVYYAAIAGNSTFPLEMFDEKGNHLYSTETDFDIRGMWWNPGKKTLEANGFGDYGVVQYSLNGEGRPLNTTSLTGSSGQPDDQSVGAYDSKNGHIIYYADGKLAKIKRSDFSLAGTVNLALPVSAYYINNTAVIYTGVKGKEAGVLDYENKKVYLFDISSGKLTYTVNLPSGAVTHDLFRFSFANGHIWLYDVYSRSWTGYKLF